MHADRLVLSGALSPPRRRRVNPLKRLFNALFKRI